MAFVTELNPDSNPDIAPNGDRRAAILLLVRSLCHLIVVVSIVVWGFVTWENPWLWLTGPGFGVLAVLIWALFLSPRAVLRTDRFGGSLIELLFIAAGVGALLGLGVPWLIAVVFGVVAAVLGYIANVGKE